MWPIKLDLSRDECKKCLRCLELEAYGSMVSVLRAQGSFTNEKQKLLQELAKALHISNERHRAEVRRAVNDEKLSTIAEQLNGPNTGTDWAIEGRRIIPLLPRLNPRNVFTSLANSLSLATSVANTKMPSTSAEKSTDVKVKVETESAIKKVEENESPADTTIKQTDNHSISRKRRRSRVELEDLFCNVTQREDTTNNVKDVVRPFSRLGSESISPVPVSLSNKVIVVSTSSALDLAKNSVIDNTATITTVNSWCSTTSITSLHDASVHTSGSSSSGSIATVPCKAMISANISHTHVPTQVSRSVSTVVPTYVTAIPTSIIRGKVISTQSKVQPKTTSLVIPNSGPQNPVAQTMQSEVSDVQTNSDIDRSVKLVQLTSCVQKTVKSSGNTSPTCLQRITSTTQASTRPTLAVKSMTPNSGPRLVTVNTGVASSGPGPPSIRPTTAVLRCKKMSAVKPGQQATKMGITLNSSKTVNIGSNSGSRVAAKANVIVVQKGPARGVTLSHAGKEVLGKVIMGGKNLCLSNQQSAGTIALLPRRISTNGEQSLAMLSPISSPQPECVKTNTKSGNMIVFDLRQDSLEKSKVLSEILEASGVFGSESKTAILNTNSHTLMKEQNTDVQTPICPKSKSPHLKSGANFSFVMDTNEHRKNKETIDNVNADIATSPVESQTEDSKDGLAKPDCMSEIQGTLDPQTGIYTFQTSENNLHNIQTDESMPSSEIDIFSTALASTDINLENFQYVDTNESNNVLDDVRSQILTIDQINDLYESHQSITDKSNC
ncbi:BRCA2-interacting transcriptional repressor EMSY isoform X2 [Athalia rosae]|uniref:BRCA2-interacting transcriptional repressor EMSY isoform X2 n=1 Tax=Athalia rosae TaxID=37344 RepID=UPI002033693B|nr:BRCA2-interacting transcriptional repressor EMSY isoform X2 [Athalia rosae]